MANDDSVTISFRLNLNREEDMEIQRFLENDTTKFCYGDKSKFIKKALIRAIQGIKQEEFKDSLMSEMSTQRISLQDVMSEEADRIISAVKLIVEDEVETLAGMQTIEAKQTGSEMAEPKTEAVKKSSPCFGEIPEASDEDVSEDVMAFLEDL
jgi:hypothetical protein